MKISYGRQFIDNKDKLLVKKALSENLITQGKYIDKFENTLKNYFSCKFVSVVSSGTAAMHLVGMALDWKKNDIILMSPITFLSTANIVDHLSATPDFVDIDQASYNIDLKSLEEKILFYKKKNKQIKAVVATDYAGLPCNWIGLKYLAKKYNFDLINDNCHAIGAKYDKKKSYATDFALASTHSYHPVKNFTTGEGGAILTNNKKLYEKIIKLRTHGIEKKNKNIPWFYDVNKPGFNYRITDFQCALGISQLKKLNLFLKKKKSIAKFYYNFFKDHPNISLPQKKLNYNHAYHLFPLLINFKKIRISKSKFFQYLETKNISLQVHYIPTYHFSYFKKKFKFKKKNFPNSEKFYDQEVSLPIYYSLKKSQLERVCKTILDGVNTRLGKL